MFLLEFHFNFDEKKRTEEKRERKTQVTEKRRPIVTDHVGRIVTSESIACHSGSNP